MRGISGALLAGIAGIAALAAFAPASSRAADPAQGSPPADFAALLGEAQALNAEMARLTNGNLPLVDGLQDSDENRAIWAQRAPRALDCARQAVALRPDSAAAAAALANAYMFHASSLGVIRSILEGSSGEYRKNASRLVELDASYDDGLGDYFLAAFYLVAPWPLADADAALEHYRRAESQAPASVRNQYGLAVYFARQGDAGRARQHFARVVADPCTTANERLFCDWMKGESARVLETLAPE
jgi:tetratricopeptide (TPR) repeat protein